MEKFVFEAKPRLVIGKQVKALRRQGLLPGIIYGHNVEPIAISLDMKTATKVLPTVSTTHLVEVNVDGKPHITLVREKQRHPVTGVLLHIDFQEVSMTEKLRTSVRIELVGESPAVKMMDAIIVSGQEQLDIECLPADLPEKIVVDISGLKTFGNAIYVRDVVLPSGVSVLNNPAEMVVVATAPASDEKLEGTEGAVSPEVEVVEKAKKEEVE